LGLAGQGLLKTLPGDGSLRLPIVQESLSRIIIFRLFLIGVLLLLLQVVLLLLQLRHVVLVLLLLSGVSLLLLGLPLSEK